MTSNPPALLSETKLWPRLSIKFDDEGLSSMSSYSLSAHSDVPLSVAYYANGVAAFGDAKGDDRFFETDSIRSIEWKSLAEFKGSSGESALYKITPAQGGKAFAKLVGESYPRNFQLGPEWDLLFILCFVPIVALVAGALLYCIFIIGGTMLLFPPEFTTYSHERILLDDQSFSYWDRSKRLALKKFGFFPELLTVIWYPFTFIGSVWYFSKHKWQERGAYYHYSSGNSHCVYLFMTDGRRIIVAETYLDRSTIIQAHADHVAAWQTAKLSKQATQQKVDESDAYL